MYPINLAPSQQVLCKKNSTMFVFGGDVGPFQVEVGCQFERKRAEHREEEDRGDLQRNQRRSKHFPIT